MNARTVATARIEIAALRSVKAAVISLALIFAGCGGGGGGSAPAAVNTVPSNPPALQTAANSLTVTSDDYGMDNATYLAASKSSVGIVLRAAIASSMTDPNFKTVSRIDIPAGTPLTSGGVYSLGPATAGTPAFPGNIYFFNGHQSTLLRTVGGTVTFRAYGSNSGDRISGSYSAVVEDGNDTSTPKASYTIAADFDFVTDSYAPVLPAPGSATLAASGSYEANCASCHALGSLDPTSAGAPDLALKGGRMNGMFSSEAPGHQGIRLAAGEVQALKVLLNIN
jgi:hypothetical protein